MKRYIKFMISFRSIEKIERELNRLGIPITEIDYGVVRFPEKLNSDQSFEFDMRMPALGFEVLDPASSNLLDQASAMIKDLVYHKPHIAISDYPAHLEEELQCDEWEINHIFSQVLGISVCQRARLQQVERIKEMILYDELGLDEVARILHLENETAVARILKDVTGMSPSYYQRVGYERKMVRQGKDYYLPIKNGICFKTINVAN